MSQFYSIYLLFLCSLGSTWFTRNKRAQGRKGEFSVLSYLCDSLYILQATHYLISLTLFDLLHNTGRCLLEVYLITAVLVPSSASCCQGEIGRPGQKVRVRINHSIFPPKWIYSKMRYGSSACSLAVTQSAASSWLCASRNCEQVQP